MNNKLNKLISVPKRFYIPSFVSRRLNSLTPSRVNSSTVNHGLMCRNDLPCRSKVEGKSWVESTFERRQEASSALCFVNLNYIEWRVDSTIYSTKVASSVFSLRIFRWPFIPGLSVPRQESQVYRNVLTDNILFHMLIKMAVRSNVHVMGRSCPSVSPHVFISIIIIMNCEGVSLIICS
jgi:hypothetical protein